MLDKIGENTDFDFKQIRIGIKNNQFNKIGSGSGRNVFDLENGYAVKMAKNKKGYSQNIIEYFISMKIESELFAKIIAVSDDFSFVIMLKAEKVTGMRQVREYFNAKNNRQLVRTEEIRTICLENEIFFNDIVRAANWGIINDKPTIIDYGFTKDVRKRFY